MPFVLAMVFVGLLIGLTFYAIAHEPGVTATDAAIAYQQAVATNDRLAIYELLATELRGGVDRRTFARARDGADQPVLHRVPPPVEIVSELVHGDTAVVHTRTTRPDREIDEAELHLERRVGRWFIIGTLPTGTIDS